MQPILFKKVPLDPEGVKMTNKTKSGGKKNLQAVEARDSQVHNDGLPGCDVIGASMHNHSVDGRMDVKESRS